MSKTERFQDLGVWIKAREISKSIYLLTKKEDFKTDYALVRQINASSGSVMDNIAEGFNRGGNKEFIQFLYIAKGSAAESLSQINRALDREHINANEFEIVENDLTHLTNMIGKFISYLKTSDFKGPKFSPSKTQNSEQ